MSNGSKFTVRNIIGAIGVGLVVIGLILLLATHFISTTVEVPNGSILTTTGQVIGCTDTVLSSGKSPIRKVGQISYEFSYTDHAYSNQDTDPHLFTCTDSRITSGASIPVYFLQENPNQSKLTIGRLYGTRPGPIPFVAVGLLITGIVGLIPATIKRLRE